jgi:biopolymer transport protein ExbB/TolQ
MNAIISDTALRAVEQSILGLLLALGSACVGLFIWRWRAVGLARTGMLKWRDRLSENLTGDLPEDYSEAADARNAPAITASVKIAGAKAGSMAGRNAAGAPSHARKALSETGAADRLIRLGLDNSHLCPEALEKLLESQETRERHLMERGAQFLGTVGANAPFLGLTGTVLGILSAFRHMAAQGGNGGVQVMSAIAGALIATAVGLLVAIPAVVLYNLLKARIRRTMDYLGELRSLLIARSLQAVAKEAF